MEQIIKTETTFTAGIDMNVPSQNFENTFKNIYSFECFDPEGNLKWSEETSNIVVAQGINDFLDKYFKGSNYTAAFYIGLKGIGTPEDGDTMASHATWSEVVPYSNAARPELVLGTVASKSVDNSASKATFNINATATVYGGFMSTNSAKSGTTGILYGAADFGTAREVQSGDTLNVTVTLTGASA